MFQPVSHINSELQSLYTRLDHLDTDYDILEDAFSQQIERKEIEIEQLDPVEIEEKEVQMEFQELKRLEKQLKRVEKEKLRLLQREKESEEALLLTSGKRALDLEEVESQIEMRTRERQRQLTKLYSRLNSRVKESILANEGVSRSTVRKIQTFVKDRHKDSRLFEGIRD